jgi:hypothetical protein
MVDWLNGFHHLTIHLINYLTIPGRLYQLSKTVITEYALSEVVNELNG